MTLPPCLLPVLLAAATPAAATPAPVRLEFPLAGYRIDAYDVSSFRMALPVPGKSSWFSVEIYCSDTIAAKPAGQNQSSFHGRSGETLLYERALSSTESQAEYTLDGGKPAELGHAYVRTVLANGKTYKISGGLPDTDWPAAGTKLKECVNSFDPSPASAPGKTVFPRQACRISLLDGALPANAQGMLLGFGHSVPTVIVSIEPYAGTLKDYQAVRQPPRMIDSKHPFKILAENSPAENALVTEYGEDFSTDKTHPQFSPTCYEKVVLAHGQLYRAWVMLTNQADQPSFPQIKASVESLAALPAPSPPPAK